jgi:cytochrome c oxidase subunit 1
MPRRYVDYPEAFTYWNKVSSIGYAITAVGVGVFLLMLHRRHGVPPQGRSQSVGRRAHDAGVDASSPPPFHQFNELPVIKPDVH